MKIAAVLAVACAGICAWQLPRAFECLSRGIDGTYAERGDASSRSGSAPHGTPVGPAPRTTSNSVSNEHRGVVGGLSMSGGTAAATSAPGPNESRRTNPFADGAAGPEVAAPVEDPALTVAFPGLPSPK